DTPWFNIRRANWLISRAATTPLSPGMQRRIGSRLSYISGKSLAGCC
ncbi:MAG: hypothetical protein H0X70_08580, partial [Segetibacter sp.]|nr:hypothetical protein [Segetibacter sp.]